MWIKIEVIDSDKNLIEINNNILKNGTDEVCLKYGNRKIYLKVIEREGIVDSNIVIIKIDKIIKEELLLNEDIYYQFNLDNNTLNIGPVIGILLGEQHYYYHDRYMKEITDALGFYKKIGGLIFAFRSCSIDWDNKQIYGLYYNYEQNYWNYGVFPFPDTIVRKGFNNTEDVVLKLKNDTYCNIFNSYKFEKWQMYKLLNKESDFEKYLPETIELININDVKNLLDKYSKVILKPSKLSRGRGIYILEKNNDKYKVYDYTKDKIDIFNISGDEIYEYIDALNLYSKSYIVQRFLNLAKINKSPFDIRIVMQKGINKEWKCSGIECRIAGQNTHITNIARGSSALHIIESLKLAFGIKVNAKKIKQDIIDISKTFCKIMDTSGERFAEFGMDLAIDEDMNYWFIEANVRPTFKGFKRLDLKNYYYICRNLLDYAVVSNGFRRQSEPYV